MKNATSYRRNHSMAGIARRNKYNETDKFKVSRKRWDQEPKGRFLDRLREAQLILNHDYSEFAEEKV